MKQQKLRIRIEPKKERKTWEINPKTRIHSEKAYNRSKEKDALRQFMYEEEEEE